MNFPITELLGGNAKSGMPVIAVNKYEEGWHLQYISIEPLG
ncbi:MAG TPA: hypothetical protein PLF29_01910 [bacterium]|nr:hypothetical protein [bacterium]